MHSTTKSTNQGSKTRLFPCDFTHMISFMIEDTLSSVASPICQEEQSERTFSIFAFSSRFFLFFPNFSWFFPSFSRFLANFALSGVALCPPLYTQWLRHWILWYSLRNKQHWYHGMLYSITLSNHNHMVIALFYGLYYPDWVTKSYDKIRWKHASLKMILLWAHSTRRT